MGKRLMKKYKKDEVWRNAHDFLFKVYERTKDFPCSENFLLISQLRGAALSLVTDIVKMQVAVDKKEFINKMNISLSELEYMLELARDLKYIAGDKYKGMEKLRAEIEGSIRDLIG